MKFLSLFFFVVVAVSFIEAEEPTKEAFMTAATACKDEVGASDDDLEAMKLHQPAASTEGKCMRACVMKKFGLMNDEGKMVRDIGVAIGKAMIKEEDKKDLAETIVDACVNLEVDADHCEAASQYGECINAQVHEHGLKDSEEL